MDVKYIMATIRRRRRRRRVTRPFMRRQFQKGKGILHPRAKGVTSEDVLDFPLLGLLAGASWVTQKVADSKRKKL